MYFYDNECCNLQHSSLKKPAKVENSLKYNIELIIIKFHCTLFAAKVLLQNKKNFG
jgi:hypothetical protein